MLLGLSYSRALTVFGNFTIALWGEGFPSSHLAIPEALLPVIKVGKLRLEMLCMWPSLTQPDAGMVRTDFVQMSLRDS